ncbi:MAG: hypothetical protein DSY37_00800 [Hyperthermus sp.]|nr:MAG: hypothetical protein DSY37_00800 [Hyperthermus sp.]
MKNSEWSLDIGSEINLLSQAFAFLEEKGGSLSPYVATWGDAGRVVVALLTALLKRRGKLVYYEPGCGEAKVAGRVAEDASYTLCIELDESLAEKAWSTVKDHAADVVVADLAYFEPRRADVVYTYLLPKAIQIVINNLSNQNAIIVSLDYPSPGYAPLEVARIKVGEREIYIYYTFSVKAKPAAGGGQQGLETP